MTEKKGLILLDRDGVLNEMVIDPEQGTVDSPLHPDQVRIFPWVADSLLLLQKAGYYLAIVTNQPAAAKKKTTIKNLEDVHAKVVHEAQRSGAEISTSQICFHRAEDFCECRKPKTALLEAAFKAHPRCLPSFSWMVGDGVTDVQAGAALHLNTSFIGVQKADIMNIFHQKNIMPSLWCSNLMEFAKKIVELKALG